MTREMNETKQINITKLNFDTISIVAKYLNIEDIISMSSTCKFLRNEVDVLLRGKPITIGYEEITSEETVEKIKSLNLDVTAFFAGPLEEFSFDWIGKITYMSWDDFDATPFKNIRDVDLSGSMMLSDVSMLGDVHTLNLTECRNVSDVSMLGKLHTLNLSRCFGVTDVSMLGNLYALNLTLCNISDVSMLGNVYSLDLSYCINVSDFSMLGNVHSLNLTGCYNISDVSMFRNVYVLNLSECENISDVSMLGNAILVL